MAITLEAVDQVIERTGCTYQEAKEALTRTDGDPARAITLLEGDFSAVPVEEPEEPEEAVERAADFEEETEEPEETDDFKRKQEELIAKIKEAVRKGNVNQIRIRRNGEEVITIPVNVGLGLGVVGMFAAPWALIAGAVASYALDCKFELIKNDGTIDEL